MTHTIQRLLAIIETIQILPAGLSLPVPAHRARSCSTDSILLKKLSIAFSTSSIEKRGFQLTPIFNGLQPPKMPVHPCTGRSLSKNVVFQQAAGPCYVSHTIERAARGTETDSPAHS
ncbi:MAG: hypothetical protein DRR11_06300 [Gammaproteobacteria bacterium]|nr:MAG: hypothetical protein DRR11_06300 [Gammaproteobacteria bacterium]RLA36705.1 MAG: hypothetical protein DRR15_04200 [Gammaproteobacteria bacterium]